MSRRESANLAWLIDAKYFARYLKAECYNLPAHRNVASTETADNIQERLYMFDPWFSMIPPLDRYFSVNKRKIKQKVT